MQISKNYGITTKQMYLLYLIYYQEDLEVNYFKNLAEILNISASTLSRNIQKLVDKDLISVEEVSGTIYRTVRLKSKGQLIALEIKDYLKKYYK